MCRVCPPAPNCKKGIAGGLKVIVNKTRSVWGKGDELNPTPKCHLNKFHHIHGCNFRVTKVSMNYPG